MSVYLFLYAGALVSGFILCNKKLQPWGKPVYCAGCGLAFILISALRFSTGHDYNSYASIFDGYTFLSPEEIGMARLEKGISIPLDMLNQYSDTYIPMFVLTSILIYAGVFFLIHKNSSLPWVSVIAFLSLGVFFNSLNFLRQFIAAIVVAFAIRFIEVKNPYKYLLCVIIASVFHWSALIMIPFYVILRLKPGPALIASSSGLLIIIYIFSFPIMKFLTETFYMYRAYDPESSVEMTTGLPVTYTLMFLIPFIICMFFRKRLYEKNPMNYIYINCLLFAAFFEAIGVKHAIISRFALLFFLPPIAALAPDLCLVIKEYIDKRFRKVKTQIKMIVADFALVSAFLCFLALINVNYNGVMPYRSIVNMNPNDYYRQNAAVPPDDKNVGGPDAYYEDPGAAADTSVDAEISAGEDINIEDYYEDWDNFDWNEENWDDE